MYQYYFTVFSDCTYVLRMNMNYDLQFEFISHYDATTDDDDDFC